MAKVLCAISGIEYKAEHFPIYLHSREHYHPIFSAPQKKLLSYASKYFSNGLTEVDSYLLYLALLNSTELIDWRVPAQFTKNTPSMIANNMEALIKTVGQINIISHPSLRLSQIAVNADNKTLENSLYWIQNWNNSIQEFNSAYNEANRREKLKLRESALEVLIKNPYKTPESYANSIAEWASQAGDFPKFNLILNNKTVTLSEYWKTLIRKAAKNADIFSIEKSDLAELIEHCEEYIPHGTIFAATLMKLLRDAMNKQNDFLGLDSVSSFRNTYTILSDTEEGSSENKAALSKLNVEERNLLNIVNSAPLEKPVPENYPTKLAYLKAKVNWDIAKSVKTQETSAVNKAILSSPSYSESSIKPIDTGAGRNKSLRDVNEGDL